MIIVSLQLATPAFMKELGMKTVKALLAGTSMNFTKPLLVTEVRRIMPTSAGLPLEFSLYTAAVATASVQGDQVPHIYSSLVCQSKKVLICSRLKTFLIPDTAIKSQGYLGSNYSGVEPFYLFSQSRPSQHQLCEKTSVLMTF